MKFRSIVYKNFKFNFQKYFSLFLCNSFTIMFLFLLIDLMVNKNFQTYVNQTKLLSSLVLLFVIIVSVFSLFFIIYSQLYFNKSRSKDLAIYLTLGISKSKLFKVIIFENTFLIILSLFTGLLTGSVFTRLFFLLTLKISKFHKIRYEFNPWSYLYTTIVFLFITCLVVIICRQFINKVTLKKLLKLNRENDSPQKSHILYPLLGVVLIFLSILILFMGIKEPYEVTVPRYAFPSVIICFSGLLLVIWNIPSILHLTSKGNKRLYYKNLLLIKNISSDFKNYKKIVFSSTILVIITLFGIGFFTSLKEASISSIDQFYPYHIGYFKTNGVNNLSEEKVDLLLGDMSHELTYRKTITFPLINGMLQDKKSGKRFSLNIAVLSKDSFSKLGLVDSLSEKTRSFIESKTPHGSGFVIRNFYNYMDDNFLDNNLIFKNKISEYSIKPVGYENNLLHFFNVPFASFILIVNNDDFNNLSQEEFSLFNFSFNLFNFDNWENSGLFVSKLENELSAFNENSPRKDLINDDRFKVYSTYKENKYRRESGNIASFLSIFVSCLFFMASSILLYLKINTEVSKEKERYIKLLKIGIDRNNFKTIVYKEMAILFFSPLFFGSLIAYLYLFTFFNLANFPLMFYIKSSYLFLLYLAFQIIYYALLTKRHFKKVTTSIK